VEVLLSTSSYPTDLQDWRGRFIANMVESLAKRDDVKLHVWAPPGAMPQGIKSATTTSDGKWLIALAQHGGIAQLLRTRKALAGGFVLQLLLRLAAAYRREKVDIVHVNWLQNALPLWGTKTPALITVLGTDFALLKLPGMVYALRSMLKQRHAILAPNSQWMVPALQSYFGDVAEIREIAFGVDDAWFNVERKHTDTGHERHWLAITRLTHNKIGELFQWGDGLFDASRQLHLFGPMQEDVTLPGWVYYHGPTHPVELRELWLPQASGLITLSRHDEGRPQVMLEAMAAGLPILASNLPAHYDMIRHGQTGWIVNKRSDLAAGLLQLEDYATSMSIANAARQWVRETVGVWDDCAARYAKAYSDILDARP
jgi:glycosyltransferase involved in cell wall biosynthesis